MRIAAFVSIFFILMIVDTATQPPAVGQQPESTQDVEASGPVIHYQGQLLDASTREPKADGTYPMTFKLYTVNSGGTALWSETKSVTVSRGVFSTLLGDSTALDVNHFSGQDLWLGVAVGSDAEAKPRKRIAFSPYAIYSDHSAGAIDADKVDGKHASAFANASHNHDGGQITTGTIADARVAGTLARDNEVMGIVKANDGTGSGVDADMLDGQQASAFSGTGHNHLGQTWTGTDNPLEIVGEYEFGSAPLILSNTGAGYGMKIAGTGSDGIHMEDVGSDGIEIQNAKWGLWLSEIEYTGIYVSSGGTGISSSTNSTSNGISSSNYGSGLGLYAYSSSGTASKFASSSGEWLIEAYDMQNSNTRFKVSRAGHVYLDGIHISPAADFAELLPATGGLAAGDVLVIGADGLLSLSTQPNGTQVVGVYSTRPALLGGVHDDMEEGGQGAVSTAVISGSPTPPTGKVKSTIGQYVITDETDLDQINAASLEIERQGAAKDIAADLGQLYIDTGKVPLAVTGVVPTKVTDENGSIQPGDLLTTSSTPGHAMVAMPVDVGGAQIYRTGTILGKALEAHQAGSGVISVLVTLQ